MKRIMDPCATDCLNVTGQNIKRLREAAGLTQAELSAKLETVAVYICRGSLSRIESGNRMVSDVELKGIAEVLQTSIDKLFQEN